MIQRYSLEIDEYESYMKHDEDGEYVKWNDVKDSVLRKDFCQVKHIVSSYYHREVPCYIHYDCRVCDIYQEKILK